MKHAVFIRSTNLQETSHQIEIKGDDDRIVLLRIHSARNVCCRLKMDLQTMRNPPDLTLPNYEMLSAAIADHDKWVEGNE